ncbi:MAG: hypothetical protein RL757_1743 [Bacteroidota bacterium]|jgi:hypothetical protein
MIFLGWILGGDYFSFKSFLGKIIKYELMILL